MKMKKLLSVAFFLLFIIPFSANATSGACSYHGGVNCNSVSSYGKVVCNDGWVNSSVNFADAEECKISYSCPLYDNYLTCRNESDYERVQQSVEERRSTQRAINSRRGLLGSAFDTSSTLGQNELDNCRDDINKYNKAVIAQNSCYDRLNQKQKDEFEASLSEDDKLLLEVGQDAYVQIKMNEYCEEKRGIGSKFNMDKEVCTEGSLEKMIRINVSFSKEFHRVLDEMPEYKGIADYNVIKALTLDPVNRKKTFSQIIRERYPNVIKMKPIVKSIASPVPVIPEGSIIKTINNPDIYIIKYVGSKKFKRLILSPSVFNNYGHLKWEDVMDVNQATLDSFTTSELVRAVGDDKIYRLYPQDDTGQKRMIKNNSVLTRLGLDLDSIYEINSFDRESYGTGVILE
jgi:hypothetical protein